jgi:uncharacterized caspase-like protein
MAYKPLDLQISVPRTPESSTQQSQLNHKPIVNQIELERDTAQQTELRRSRNTEVEQGGNRGISSNEQRDGRASSNRKRKEPSVPEAQTEQQEERVQSHPYKGKHIDISL